MTNPTIIENPTSPPAVPDGETTTASSASPAVGDTVEADDKQTKLVTLCHHIRENGFYCGRPALSARQYCYQHLRLRGQQMRIARAIAKRQYYRLDLPALETLDEVQAALTHVTRALGAGLLDSRRAGQLLYSLQQISCSMRFAAKLQAQQAMAAATGAAAPPSSVGAPADRDPEHGPPLHSLGCLSPLVGEKVGENPSPAGQPRQVEEYPQFEAEFGLPQGLDLTTPPQVAFPPPEETFTATGGSTTPIAVPPPRGKRWSKDDIEAEELQRQRPKMSEAQYQQKMRALNDREWKQTRSAMRKEEEASYQAEADRRNAFEEQRDEAFRNMDDGQRRAYHMGVLTGLESAERAAVQEAAKKPAAKSAAS